MLTVLLASDDRTDQVIADLAGIDRTTFSKIKNGERNPTEQQVRSLARVLGVHPNVLTAEIRRDDIVGMLEDRAKVEDDAKKVASANVKREVLLLPPAAPDYSLAEAAGLLIFLDITESAERRFRVGICPQRIAASPPDELDVSDEDGEAWIDLRRGRLDGAKAQAIRVSGRSMNRKGILPGDVLFVRRSTRAKDGDIVIASQEGGATIKELQGKRLIPHSDDPHSPIDLLEDCKLQGVVVGVHKPK